MRYDTPIYFQKVTNGQYDQKTGNYKDDVVEEDEVLASINNTRTETNKLLYGSIKKSSITIHLQNHYDKPFDYIRVGTKVYKSIDDSIRLRRKHIFIVSEG